MTSCNERVCVNLCVKSGKTATETVLMLEQVFGSADLSRVRVLSGTDDSQVLKTIKGVRYRHHRKPMMQKRRSQRL